MKKTFAVLYVIVVFLFPICSFGQLSHGGSPLSFDLKHVEIAFQEIAVGQPDFEKIVAEDFQTDQQGLPPRFAQGIAVSFNTQNSGTWFSTPDGNAIWKLGIRAEGALAMGLQFSNFTLPENSKLFIYSTDEKQLIGAFTSANNRNSGQFATSLINGDGCIVELNLNGSNNHQIPFVISEVLYAYRFAGDDFKSFSSSDYCEVNVNCSPEGDSWQNPKRGVARIQVKVGSSAYWCSGSLLNNTKLDKTPYVLTADHCAYQLGGYATAADLENWMFYFNYEGLFCESENPVPGYLSLSGATKIAQGGNRGATGSDFYLVRLMDEIPANAHVYFNGWTAKGDASESGVTIHHPDGDIKKISTYDEALVSSSWSGNGLSSHWRVVWTETINGWGVTEGGSSGSPLFDMEGRILGTLTGGLAACDSQGSIGPDKPDYYGKFSYHYESNGTADTAQLKPWLDPLNTGVVFLNGLATDIQENQVLKSEIKLYPNPTDAFCYVEFTKFAPTSIQVTILNILGKTVLEQEMIADDGGLQLDLHHIEAGTYFVKFYFNQHTETHKLLIQ